MFITFEGVDGCGKTTQVRLLAEMLEARGVRTRVTREPGGARISEQIRALVLDTRSAGMDSWTEALLYVAARAQFVAEVVRPALAGGETVICDRYADSTLAYQGYGRGLDLATLALLNEVATRGVTPDLTFLIDVPVRDGLRRRHAHGDLNRLDLAGDDFHVRVAAGYHALAATGGRWRVIDGMRDIPTVAAHIWAIVAPLVG